MDASHEETPILSIGGTPTTVRHTRIPYPKQLAVYLILASLLFERIAFYSIAANLIDKLGEKTFLGWDYRDMLIAGLIFTGTSYFSTLIFAVISDAILGRAKTILLGFSIYLTGYVLAVLITHPTTRPYVCRLKNTITTSSSFGISNEPCADLTLPMIIIIALGAGAVQSNMAVLGAEQMQESKITSRYFDKYMMAVNIGGVIAKLTFSFTQKDGLDDYYIICLVAIAALAVAAVLFLIGWRHYRFVQPYDSVITNCIPVVINALKIRSQYRKNKRRTVGDDYIEINQEPSTLLDYAKAVNGGKFHDRIVDDVKSLRTAVVVFGFFIFYFITYTQVNSSFPLQGQYMDTSNDPRRVTWVSLADPVTIIIGIFVLNMFVYKRWDVGNQHIGIATKFVVGMIFACATMCLAGSIEIVRQIDCNNSTFPNSNSSSLSIYAQLPQNIGMGLSEIFAMVASYEFAYYAAPRSAQSLFMSLRFCILGISSFGIAVFVYLFPSPPVPSDAVCPNDDPSKWSFYAYFFILAGLQLLFIPIFIVCQRKLQIIQLNPEKIEDTRFASTSCNQGGSST